MTSWVWAHFVKNGNQAKCKVVDIHGKECGEVLTYKGATSSLSYHLVERHHLQKGEPAHKQPKIDAYAEKPSGFTLSAKEALCVTWAVNALTYELIDNPLFRMSFRSSIPLGFNRVQLSAEMVLLSGGLSHTIFHQTILALDRLRGRFAEVVRGQFVTLAIDGGQVQRKLQTVTVICNKKAYFWQAVKVQHSDHQTILSILEHAKAALEGAGAIVVAVVADNHSGNQKVCFTVILFFWLPLYFRQWTFFVQCTPGFSRSDVSHTVSSCLWRSSTKSRRLGWIFSWGLGYSS